MNRILLITSLCLLASFSFAQKKAVREAKAALESNKINDARDFIKPALEHEDTGNKPDTWKLAGDIEYKVYSTEYEKEVQKLVTNKGGANEEAMYNALPAMYKPYLKADEIAQTPDDKGKIKNRVRREIVSRLRETYPMFMNGGIFFLEKNDYKKSTDFFEIYWDMPNLPMFAEEKTPLIDPQDTVYAAIKYHAVASAIQSGDHDRSIKLAKRLIDEPYVKNTTYKPSDLYELLASEYLAVGDSASHEELMVKGAQLFTDNIFFVNNAINKFIREEKSEEALKFINQALANTPGSKCDLLGVKGSLLAADKKYPEAEAAYLQALTDEPNCEAALEGVSVLYILQAQEIKDVAAQTTNRKEQGDLDKQTIDLYLKALPYLEKYRDLLKGKETVDSIDVRAALVKLQNVYYNLSIVNVDKSKELEAVDNELGEKTKL